MNTKAFEIEYKKLNSAQKSAVDSIEGPVMVVAGPGTGKTRISALRVGNILKSTDTKADGILCLTFTRSGVTAMKKRLEEYLGSTANDVHVSTFHSFAIDLIERHYELLDFTTLPKLLDEDEAIILIDEILENNDWEYLRPRTNPVMYFNDLKQLISILKRERLTPEDFLKSVENEAQYLKSDPDSISTRGDSKGKLKKEIEKKIESLARTEEVVEFYKIYEDKKKESAFIDYDDALEYAVQLVEKYEDVRADIREEYNYVLVDEHQDSSGVQNNFLKAVWHDTELPNIFVVGDDRQLIYGFSGAKLDYFKEFSTLFGKAKFIPLTENYRSTEKILSLADDLLQSSITTEKLSSNKKENHKVELLQFAYPRDEIIGAGIYFKKMINSGLQPEECALLVPKNHHVRTAMGILRDMGVKVSSGKSVSLFEARETESFLLILNILTDPLNSVFLAESLLNKASGIETLDAHKFLKGTKASKLTIEEMITHGSDQGLFKGENSIAKWGNKLKAWLPLSHEKPSVVVSTIGNELLIDTVKEHDELLANVEVVRSFIHTSLLFEQKNNPAKLEEFLAYFKRLKSYGNHVSLATFGASTGVQVMTLHKSKGLEYEAVWIAHMNEEVLMSGKKNGFTLPEEIKGHLAERDIEAAKRELYVAITRAKTYCNISYAEEGYTGTPLTLAGILQDLPKLHFDSKTKEETEKEILSFGAEVYTKKEIQKKGEPIGELKEFVKENYADTKVSVTLLNNFFECTWKWYFRNFLRLPEVKSVSLALGSAVHSTIEYILKNKSLPKDTEIKAKIQNELLKEGVDAPIELKRLSRDAEVAVKYWIKNYYKNLAEDYVSERSVQFRDADFPSLLMYGKIDLTERFPGVVVTDFKTGTSKTKSVIEKLDKENRLSSYLRQLTMYAYLIKGTEGDKDITALRLLFLEADQDDKNALYSTHISEEQIDLLKKDIRDYDNLLKTGEWVNRPCNYNSFGKNTECPYCKRGEIYK